MVMKVFLKLIILLAIAIGAFSLVFAVNSTASRDQIMQIIHLRDFFDVTVPILAFGALMKYLCS